MTNRYDGLSDRARWFLNNFDEIGLADICAAQEASNQTRDAANARVRALHHRNENTGDCEHCSEHDYPDYAVPWPCPTIAALDPKDTP
jgi:hypothetical protein